MLILLNLTKTHFFVTPLLCPKKMTSSVVALRLVIHGAASAICSVWLTDDLRLDILSMLGLEEWAGLEASYRAFRELDQPRLIARMEAKNNSITTKTTTRSTTQTIHATKTSTTTNINNT